VSSMIYELEYKLTLEAPVILTAESNDQNTVCCSDYIPGYVILGALAKEYGRKDFTATTESLHLDHRFFHWFLSEEVLFLNAYISGEMYEEEVVFRPASFYLQTDKDEECLSFFPALKEDKRIDLIPIKNYIDLRTDQDGNGIVTKKNVDKDTNFHIISKNRQTENNDSEGIYQYEYIKKGQVFIGSIRGSKADLDELKCFFDSELRLTIGKSRNTQYGRAKIEFDSISMLSNNNGLDDRELFFVFDSHALLLNEYGFYDCSENNLYRYLRDAFLEVPITISKCISKPVLLENYSSVKKYKSGQVVGLMSGSSFTLYLGGNDKPGTFLQIINNLLYYGIGERKHEGFGQLRRLPLKADSDLGMQYFERVTPHERPAKPNIPIPIQLSKILQSLVVKDIFQGYLKGAQYKAAGFSNLPTNSQLSRLERMLSDSKDYKDYKNKLNNMKSTARIQLESCRTGDNTLYNFLQKFSLDANSIDPILNRVAEEISIDLKDIYERLAFDFTKYYLTNLFRCMRKMNKNAGKEGR
jgi:CRISPR-associated protein Csx10